MLDFCRVDDDEKIETLKDAGLVLFDFDIY